VNVKSIVDRVLQLSEEYATHEPQQRVLLIHQKVGAEYGGLTVYVPKRLARPSGGFVGAARMGPASDVRDVMRDHGVSLRTAWRWVRGR